MSPRRWISVAIALVIAAGGLSWLILREPGLRAADANGSYAHDCCGTVTLRDGKLSFGTRTSIRYSVRRDEAGPYILPRTYVGTWEDRGFQVDGSRPAVKLRLDRFPNPTRIELYDVRRSYSFSRKAPKAR